MKKLDKNIRITAVDNFQGEENDIILMSLVRSNEAVNIVKVELTLVKNNARLYYFI